MRRRTLIVVTKSAVSMSSKHALVGLQVTIAGAKTAGFAVRSEGELARVLNHPPPGHQIIEELIESAQARWRALNAPHLVTLVRAGVRFEKGTFVERPR